MFLAQVKEHTIFEELQKADDGPGEPFNTSLEWFANNSWKYGYPNTKMSREAASAVVMTAEWLVETLKAIIEEGGYSAKQISNLDKMPHTHTHTRTVDRHC